MTDRLPTRPTWAEVSRSALRSNYQALRAQAHQVDADIAGVVKANAYGHGAAEALKTLANAGCRWFAVTSVEEALTLEPRTPESRMLVLSGLYAGEAAAAVHGGLTPILASVEQIVWLADAVEQASKHEPYPFHLEIDTGMARQGVQWDDAAALQSVADCIAAHPQLQLEAVMTHFASPEDTHSSQTREQMERFGIALNVLRQHGCHPPLIHAGNSASLFEPDQAHALRDIAQQMGSHLLLRPGIGLYGCGPLAAERGLRPVLSWKTRITALRTLQAGEAVSYNATFRAARPTRIALLPVGYADGYNRLLSNRGEVLVRGRRAAIAGRITMDQTMIDVTDIPEVAASDAVILLGQQGERRITADDIAARTGTIAYEVLCAIGQRVARNWQD